MGLVVEHIQVLDSHHAYATLFDRDFGVRYANVQIKWDNKFIFIDPADEL